MDKGKQNGLPKKAKSLNDYARYSGMAFQMVAIVGLGVWGGMKIDGWLKLTFPLFTVLLSLLAVILAMYSILKDLMRTKKD